VQRHRPRLIALFAPLSAVLADTLGRSSNIMRCLLSHPPWCVLHISGLHTRERGRLITWRVAGHLSLYRLGLTACRSRRRMLAHVADVSVLCTAPYMPSLLSPLCPSSDSLSVRRVNVGGQRVRLVSTGMLRAARARASGKDVAILPPN
jgi:hypothetical protein